jgi:pimeloyl-ACP methyl ester carboxylesterase
MLAIKDETFEGLFPFAPLYYTHNGLDIHYVDEGSGESGEPVVMVHGDPTWGFLYRNFIPSLSQRFRCIVPDQMGMGKSAVPQERALYRLEQHVANIEALLLHLDLHDITLVLHDWGGPVGLGFATRHPERIKRLVLMNTWAFAPWPGGALPRLLEIIRSERGEADPVPMRSLFGEEHPWYREMAEHLQHNDPDMLALLVVRFFIQIRRKYIQCFCYPLQSIKSWAISSWVVAHTRYGHKGYIRHS